MFRGVSLALCLAAALAGCSDGADSSGGGRMDVVVGFYPAQFLVERVAGDRADVANLTQPGAEPHDLELSPRQVVRVRDADLVVLVGGLAPAVDDAVEGHNDTVLDLGTVQPQLDGYRGIEEGKPAESVGKDPHVWLDPVRMQALAAAVADRLISLDPAGRADYVAGRDRLVADLEALDGSYRQGLARCERHEVVTTHNAFGYLVARYGLKQVGIAGLTPDSEPSPARLADVTDYARAHKVTTIFFETLVSPKVARTVAAEVGATTAVLDPIEGAPDGGDYLSAMRANLSALRVALACR
jgi:zinc transport system substrate-binding protein